MQPKDTYEKPPAGQPAAGQEGGTYAVPDGVDPEAYRQYYQQYYQAAQAQQQAGAAGGAQPEMTEDQRRAYWEQYQQYQAQYAAAAASGQYPEGAYYGYGAEGAQGAEGAGGGGGAGPAAAGVPGGSPHAAAVVPDVPEEDPVQVKLGKLFDLCDKNGDGKIGEADLGMIMRAMGANPTDDELRSLVLMHDGTGDKKLTKDEYLKLMADQKLEEIDDDEMKFAFDTFDHDGDGKISSAELRYALKHIGTVLSPEEIEELIDAADANGDGEIDFGEFSKLMKKPFTVH